MTTYQIFDSMDRPSGEPSNTHADLMAELEQLQAEAIEDGDRLTYAIGMINSDGDVTFEF